ncbi:hypothetical protein BLNAU_9420 [Blattamonas nauphoetae]|uniref:Uncharacterized protein n=1 Tax=Blattamonas nauphoetae TaxID=2049346 RepID=A0ABQ9XVP8_9EUKA|nr:hypothetical protein BLNAU_9420 [Blattamonas nauphoetae]
MLFHAFIWLSLISVRTHCDVVQRRISTDGTDDKTCLTGDTACRTIHYAMDTDYVDDLSITVGPGTFDFVHQETISDLSSFSLKGTEKMTSIIKAGKIAFDNLLIFTNIQQLSLANLKFDASNTQIAHISNTNTITITDVVVDGLDTGNIYPENFFSIKDAQAVTVVYTKSDQSMLDSAISSYMFDLNTVQQASFRGNVGNTQQWGCHFLRCVECVEIKVENLNFVRSSGNMISFVDGGNLNILNSQFSFDGYYTEQPNRGNVESSSTIHFARSSNLKVEASTFKSQSFGILEIESAASVTVKTCVFVGNSVEPSVVPSAFADARKSLKEVFGGFGSILTARDVSGSITVSDSKFSNSGYNNAELQLAKYPEISGEMKGEQAYLYSADVFSLIFVQNAPKLQLSSCTFDSHLLIPQTDEKSIRSTANGIPSLINLRHTSKRRAGSLIFAEGVTDVYASYVKASKIIGSVIAAVSCQNVHLLEPNITDVRAESPEFRHSALFSDAHVYRPDKTTFQVKEGVFNNIGMTDTKSGSMSRTIATYDGYSTLTGVPGEISSGGSVIHTESMSDITLMDTGYTSTSSNGHGGAIYINGASVVDLQLQKGYRTVSPGFGGFIYVSSANSHIFQVNSAASRSSVGGSIYIDSLVDGCGHSLNSLVFSNSRAGKGGAISVATTRRYGLQRVTGTIQKSEFTGCHSMYGGAVYCRADAALGSSRISECEFTDNRGYGSGAAAFVELDWVAPDTAGHKLFISQNTFSSNRAGVASVVVISCLNSQRTPTSGWYGVNDPFNGTISNNTFQENSLLSVSETGTATGALLIKVPFWQPEKVSVFQVTDSKFLNNMMPAIGALFGSNVKVSGTEFRNNSLQYESRLVSTHLVCSHALLALESVTFDKNTESDSICDTFCAQSSTTLKCPRFTLKSARTIAKIKTYPVLPQIRVISALARPSFPFFFISTDEKTTPPTPFPYTANAADADTQASMLIPATAHIDKSQVTFMTEGPVKLVGFPDKQPDQLFLFVSPDGSSWSEPIVLKGPSASTAVAVAISVPITLTVLAVIVVIVIICLCRSKKSTRARYVDLDGEKDPLINGDDDTNISSYKTTTEVEDRV